MKDYLISKGLKVWKKGEYERIYIDVYKNGIENVTTNPKCFRGITIYYDCINNKFYYNVSNSRKSTIEEYILYLKRGVNNEI